MQCYPVSLLIVSPVSSLALRLTVTLKPGVYRPAAPTHSACVAGRQRVCPGLSPASHLWCSRTPRSRSRGTRSSEYPRTSPWYPALESATTRMRQNATAPWILGNDVLGSVVVTSDKKGLQIFDFSVFMLISDWLLDLFIYSCDWSFYY